MVTREIILEPEKAGGRAEELRDLNRRIALVAVVVVVELWGLTSALEAWGSKDSRSLPMILAAQVLAFAAGLTIWITTPRGSRAQPAYAARPVPANQPASATE